MAILRHLADRLRRDTRGVTALEYGLIAAVMGALIVAAFGSLGGDLSTAFATIGGYLSGQQTSLGTSIL